MTGGTEQKTAWRNIEAQLKPPAERTEAERQPPTGTILQEIGSMAVDIRALTAPETRGDEVTR